MKRRNQPMRAMLSRRSLAGAWAFALATALIATAQTTTTLSDSNGTWTITTNTDGSTPNNISITFHPDANNVNCPKIVFVQTCKISFDGTVYNPADIYSGWEYRRGDTVPVDPNNPAGGTFVDHLFCEKDAGYNGDDRGDPNDPNVPRQDGGTQGKAQGDGTAVTDATMYDKPYMPDGLFPPGKTHCLMEFETCAMCATGSDATTWTCLGCIKWKYERTKGSAGNGTSTLVSTAIGASSAAFGAAVSLFDANHHSGTTPICPEELDPNSCPNRVSDKTVPLLFHVNTDYKVNKAGPNVKKGRTPPDTAPPNGPIGNTLTTCDYVYVPNGESININRTPGHKSAADGVPRSIPATYIDLMQGAAETTESGTCFSTDHCGERVTDCSNTITFALVAPVNSFDPLSPIIYSVAINDVIDIVTISNDPLSAGIIAAEDVFHAMPPVTLAPGQVTTFAYPGMLQPCPSAPPGCLGDSNCDHVVSWRDIDYFVAAQNNAISAWYRKFLPGTPTCPFSNNDVNNDGNVSWRDITPFVQKMNMTCPHP